MRLLKAIVTVSLIFFLGIGGCTVTGVKGMSMYPTIRPSGTLLAFNLGQIKRGDIILLEIWNPQSSKTETWVKRVIGLPGETIEVHDDKTFINGTQIAEPYVNPEGLGGLKVNISQKLGSDEYWFMGDNRRLSYDSRNVGPIRRSHITSRFSWWVQIP